MQFAQRARNADCEVQEPSQFHRAVDQPMERLTARVVEQQDGPVLVLDERERYGGPLWIEVYFQGELVLELLRYSRARGAPTRGQAAAPSPWALARGIGSGTG